MVGLATSQTSQTPHDIFAEWKVMQSLLLTIPNPVGMELTKLNNNAAETQTLLSQRDVTRIQTFNRVMQATCHAAVQYLGTNSNVTGNDAVSIGLDCNPFQASRELFYHRIQRQTPPLLKILKDWIHNILNQQGFSADYESYMVLNDNWRDELQTKTHFCDLSSDKVEIIKPNKDQTIFFEFPLKPFQTYQELAKNLTAALNTHREKAIRQLDGKSFEHVTLGASVKINNNNCLFIFPLSDKGDINFKKDCEEIFTIIDSVGLSLDMHSAFHLLSELIVMPTLPIYPTGCAPSQFQQLTNKTVDPMPTSFEEFLQHRIFKTFNQGFKEPNLDFMARELCKILSGYAEFAKTIEEAFSQNGLSTQLFYIFANILAQMDQLNVLAKTGIDHKFHVMFANTVRNIFSMGTIWIIITNAHDPTSFKKYNIEQVLKKNLERDLALVVEVSLVRFTEYGMKALQEIRMGLRNYFQKYFGKLPKNLLDFPIYFETKKAFEEVDPFQRNNVLQNADSFLREVKEDATPVQSSSIQHDADSSLQKVKEDATPVQSSSVQHNADSSLREVKEDATPVQSSSVQHNADSSLREVKEEATSIKSGSVQQNASSLLREPKEEATPVQSSSVQKVFRQAKANEPGDCLFAEVFVPLSLEHTNYRKRDLKKQIQSQLKHAEIVCAVLDDTVQTDEIINIMNSFPQELREGKLHLIVWQSLQKYGMLGSDVYNGGMYYVVSSDKRLVQEFAKVSEAHTVNPILKYGMCHFLRTAAVSEYQKRVQQNAQLFFSLIEKRHIRTSDEVRRDELLFDDTEQTFFSSMRVFQGQEPILEFFSQYVLKKLFEKKIYCVRRVGFGFSIFDFDEIKHTLRITIGLEHNPIVKSIANTFNESCDKIQAAIKTIKPYLACLDGKVPERDRSILITTFLESWLELGHDISRTDMVEKILFSVATKLGHIELMRQLVDKSPFEKRAEILEMWFLPNKDGMNPLHFAAINNQKAAMALLIELHTKYKFLMDVNAYDNSGSTPLLYAVDKSSDTTTFRMDFIADGNKAPVAAVDKGDDTTILDLLIRAGADVNRFNRPGGFNALLTAIIRDNEKFKEFLLRQTDININAKNQKGESLMHAAATLENINILESLKEIEVEIDTPDLNGVTPLMLAVISKDTEVIEWFLTNGADNSKVDRQGNSAKSLGLASENGDVRALFEDKPQAEETAV